MNMEKKKEIRDRLKDDVARKVEAYKEAKQRLVDFDDTLSDDEFCEITLFLGNALHQFLGN